MADASQPGPRLVPLDPGALRPEQRRVYEAITLGPRSDQPFRMTDGAGRMLGPFDALLRIPEVGEAVQLLGERLRFNGVLEDRIRELIILAAAVHWRSDYEWYAHSRLARERELLTSDELDVVRQGRTPASLDGRERATLALVRTLLKTGEAPSDLYQAARDRLGEEELVEVVCLVGYYSMLAGVLATFAIPAPEH